MTGRLDHEHIWSGRRDSNPLPTAWEAVALPGELLPLIDYLVIAFGKEILGASQLSLIGMIHFSSSSDFVSTVLLK